MANQEEKRGVRGPTRTSQEDWLRCAMDVLISKGADGVKISALADKLDCAKSSFYWYFKNRAELMDALLDHWASTNTKAIIEASNLPATSINFALGQLYASWLLGDKFDERLDSAVRDWARRSGTVRRALDISDGARMDAISGMFRRHGYTSGEADVRARIVYFTQIGYAALDQRESWEVRLQRGRDYLFCMTGQPPTGPELDALIKAVSLPGK